VAIPSKGVVTHPNIRNTADHDQRGERVGQPLWDPAATVAPPSRPEPAHPRWAGRVHRTAPVFPGDGSFASQPADGAAPVRGARVGLGESNELLHAAGLPATYPKASIDSGDLAPYRAAIEQLLRAHEPYPAMVVDAHWDVLYANGACGVLFGDGVVGSNFVRDSLTNPDAARAIVNWPEVAWAGLDRLRHQLDRTPFDVELGKLVALAETALSGVAPPVTEKGALVCPSFRVGEAVVHTISMVARFDPGADVTLDGLRIELMYPRDEAAERFFRNANLAPTV
jgi:hypothetical protein